MDPWQKLEARAKKLETALRAAARPARLRTFTTSWPRPRRTKSCSCSTTPPSSRCRNGCATTIQKYLPLVQEITPEEWATIEAKPGTPKYAKARDEFISEVLNRKPKKPVEEEVPPTTPVVPVPEPAMGRRGR